MLRRRTIAALGATVTIGVATCALVSGMLLSRETVVSTAPPGLQPVAADALAAFDSCEQLRKWYVAAALPQVGPWGFGSPYYKALDGMRTPLASEAIPAGGLPAADTPVPATGSSATGTNVQEAGVDEPDLAKTNGQIVVHLHGRYLIVDDVTGSSPRELSRTALPKGTASPQLLLVGDRAVVFGDAQPRWQGGGDLPLRRDVGGAVVMPSQGRGASRIVTVDLASPAAPRVESDRRIDGRLLSERQYGDTVRAVITTGYPQLHFVHPTGTRSREQARSQNRRIVRAATIDDWLPGVRDASGTGTRPLLDCADVRHPERQSGFGTISVVTFRPGSPGHVSTTGVTAAGDLVYSSADRLYVATSAGGWPGPVPLQRMPKPAARPTTEVHAFALDGTSTRYIASGSLPGTVRDRWSFSEYDGHLRVATALGANSSAPQENAVVVLDEAGSRLRKVGRVDGIGRHEQIESVRWLGDLAIVVTFHQTDPLYTVDLSSPRHPRIIGTLEIPGFSSYLHPVGHDLLLGLGHDATSSGADLGAQAATFDLQSLRRPRRVGTVSFGVNTDLIAAQEPLAFTYLPHRHVALTAVMRYADEQVRLVSFHIGSDGSLTKTPRRALGGWRHSDVRILPLTAGRIAAVSNGVVQIIDLGPQASS